VAANIAQGAITVVRNAREGKKYSGRIGFQIQNQKPQTGGQDDEAENIRRARLPTRGVHHGK